MLTIIRSPLNIDTLEHDDSVIENLLEAHGLERKGSWRDQHEREIVFSGHHDDETRFIRNNRIDLAAEKLPGVKLEVIHGRKVWAAHFTK